MIVDREHDNHREIKSIDRCEVENLQCWNVVCDCVLFCQSDEEDYSLSRTSFSRIGGRSTVESVAIRSTSWYEFILTV
ncbi:unnamed protein product [Callosobruchus maculatus]|uniref:Uncharacterized protein n=1 Tax=Callosobruchus maculatus TaxID=64391 RepID=A0A653BL29_CALMS|nr:unnamed protein product [Callosobruchus maculatus]